MTSLSIFADNMKKRRLKLGLTQEELANKANLDLKCVTRTERKDNNPTLKTLSKICDALDTDFSSMTMEGYSGCNDEFAICVFKDGSYRYYPVDQSVLDEDTQKILDNLCKND